MKKIILSALILSLAFAVQAQDGDRHHKGRRHHGQSMQNLNLTEDQKAKFKSANESFRKQMEELKKNENITVKDQKAKMADIRKDHRSKIQGILTTEQKAQMEKNRAEGKQKREEGMKARGEKMKEKLNLTADQQAKMEANRASMKAEMKAIRENKSLDDAAKKEKMKELMKGQREKMKSILTEEQLQKMKEGHKGGGRHYDKKKTK